MLKCFNKIENYEYYENYECRHRVIFIVENKILCLGFLIIHYQKSFNIDIEVEYFSSSPFSNYIDMFRNSCVYQNFKEIVCVWTRLNLKYKNFEYCKNVLNDYILYKENIEGFLQLIEIGSRFRNQCVMHKFLLEVRKTIHDAVKSAFCDEHVLECEAFAQIIFT